MRKIITLIGISFMLFSHTFPGSESNTLISGAWKSDNGVLIVSGVYFSYAEYDTDSKTFSGTYGGKWSTDGGNMKQMIEFSTFDQLPVSQEISKTITLGNDQLSIDNEKFIRIDNGIPGKLNGAWLFAGRKQEGEMTTRDTNQPRKTMKILSGMRFQWIAYNTETGEFFGTGGGTYSTMGNLYTENIEFFSRDSSRVGATLSFEFELIDGIWHHQGLNSRGEPMYEIWSPRD